MKVQIQVNIVVRAIIDNCRDHGLIGHLVGCPFDIGATKPKILVDGESNTVSVPDTYRLVDDRNIIGHSHTADRSGGAPGPPVSRRTIFHAGNVNAFQADSASATGIDDLVARNFKLRRSGQSGRNNPEDKKVKNQKRF